MFKKYKWNFVSVILIVSIIGFIIIDVILYHSIKSYLFKQTFNEMQMKTHLAVMLLEKKGFQPLPNDFAELYDITYQIRDIVNSRVTIIDSTGCVLTDSDVARDSVRFMDNHINRPEVQQAIERTLGQSYRKSDTVNRKLFYTAYLIKHQKRNIGFLRFAYYSHNFEESMNKIVSLIIAANLIGLIILFCVALFTGTVVTFPILKIVNIAKKISAGDFKKTFPIQRKDEIGTLAFILNQLTDRLKTQISQISDEQIKLQQILRNLDIGIIVIDQKKNILHVNPEMYKILELETLDINNKNVVEIVRSEQLLSSIDNVLDDGVKKIDEFIYYAASDKKYLRYMVTPFHLTDKKITGVLIQLQNITELKKLEAIRRNFVANASHELKTPLTAIFGYAETLLEGAAENPHSRIKFIRKIREQAQRLEFLINDMLKLSELEREQPLELSSSNLFHILKEIIDEFKEKSMQKNIKILMKVPENIKVKVDEESIRTVFNNLVDNAVKYTPKDGSITINVNEMDNNRVKFEIIDNGIGIHPKYHNRIFQRFYRVDKARSRELGGTGLGLAIVKHIIEQHGSTISLKSELGKGSCFIFELEKV
jgi:two-component system phosphate regulon sensor histidine kinase PhoR